MSDTGTPIPDPPPVPAAQAAVAAAIEEMIPKSQWDREVANHIRERNLWKQPAQLLGQLDEENRQAVLTLAQMIAEGDEDGVLGWALDSAANLTGGDLAAAIARRQRAGTQQQPATPAAAAAAAVPTADEIAKIVADQIAENQRIATGRAAVAAVFTAAGYDLDDPEGQTIVRYCMTQEKTPEEGIAWYNAVLEQRIAARNGGAAAAADALTLPPVIAGGRPAAGAEAAQMTDRDRAKARLATLNRPLG